MQFDDLNDDILPEFQDFYTRVADRVNSGSILADLPNWIVKNTRLKGKAWSFKDHEFQIAIARDQSPRKAIKKCSQVGLTELQIRLALAYLKVSNGRSLGYIMPYKQDAENISKSRIDPVIESSPALNMSMEAGSNSSSYKKIGSSHLYIRGAEKVTQGISTPLDRLIIDERDFCRDRVLGVYSSRMRHADDPMKDVFSTPTISNYGICAEYDMSDKKRYLCKCLHCGFRQAPNFYNQVVIPGFNKHFLDLEKEDFILEKYDFAKSYIRCEKCGKELDSSLRLADHREWVAERPGRVISGYAVKPFDLYRYNDTPKIILQYPDYPIQQDYCNFVLGEELDTNENKINDKIVSGLFVGELMHEARDTVVGIDVGKNVHIFVGIKSVGRPRIIAIFKLRFSDGNMFKQVCEIIDVFGAIKIVIDSGPDISLPADLQEKYGADRVHPCTYIKGKKGALEFYELDKEKGTVNAARTRGFDHMVKAVNSGKYEFPRCDDDLKKEVREHFQQIARKVEYDDEGEKVFKWVKLTEMDHFFHALFYTHLGLTMVSDGVSASDGCAPIGMMGADVGGKVKIAQSGDVAKALRMFGMT